MVRGCHLLCLRTVETTTLTSKIGLCSSEGVRTSDERIRWIDACMHMQEDETTFVNKLFNPILPLHRSNVSDPISVLEHVPKLVNVRLS